MSLRDAARSVLARLPPTTRRTVLHALGRYAPWEAGFDFTPPAPAPGEVTGPPDFVGIGVQKAGTTWWYDLLLTHPRITSHEGIHKERHFLDRFGSTSFGTSDVASYESWFPRRAGTLTGEWTPDYFSFPWGPGLLERAAPDARLFLLLRDPVERFRSALAHLERAGTPRDPTAVSDAVVRGFYDRLLVDWLEHFDREQLLVLQYERCVSDRDGQLARSFSHLGLEPHMPPADAHDGGGGGQETGARAGLDDEVRARLVRLYEPDVAALAGRVPDLELVRWPNFAYLASGSVSPDSGSGENSPSERA